MEQRCCGRWRPAPAAHALWRGDLTRRSQAVARSRRRGRCTGQPAAWRRRRGPSGQPAAWQRRRRTQTDRKRKANSRRLERTQGGAKKTEIHAHATPSPLLRTASRYKQISLHAAPTALPLRRSPGWFLLFALLLSARLSCSWRLMDAGRAPTFSSDGGLALLLFLYMFL